MDQERTYKWVQARLRELNSGTIAEADRRMLESMAKDDPFIADALEGFMAHPLLDHQEYLDTLAERIHSRRRTRRRWLIPNLAVTAIAASMIIIIGIWAVMTRLSPKPENTVASAESQHTLTMNPTGDTITAYVDQNEIAAAESTYSAPAREPNPRRESTSSKNNVASRKDNTSITIADADKEVNKTDNSRDVGDKAIVSSPSSASETSQPSPNYLPVEPPAKNGPPEDERYANQMDPRIMAQRVIGHVTNRQGEPLIGANLQIEGTNLGTVSDVDGKFELFLPSPASTVAISLSGYTKSLVRMKQGEEEVAVQLDEAPVMAENVLAGSASRSIRPQKASPMMSTVTISMDDNVLFVDYLKTNSKFPLADRLNPDAKKVSVEFMVNADGHPSQIKVIDSSGNNDIDDEAVRLIRKGPDWKCVEKYPCKVNYSIYYK